VLAPHVIASFDDIDDVPASFKRDHLSYWNVTLEDWILKVATQSRNELSDNPSKSLRDAANEQSLGSLQLPIEIFQMIFLHIDLQSQRFLKATNSPMRTLISSLSEHQALMRHVPGFLDLLQRTHLVPYFPITQLYNVLMRGTCTICGQFASFVFLPAMQRCCGRCLCFDIEFMPVNVKTAVKEYGVPLANLPLLPKLSSIPGKYLDGGGRVKSYKGKRTLVGRQEARSLGTMKPKERWDDATAKRTLQRNMCSAPMPVLDPKTNLADRGRQCLGCLQASREHDEPDSCESCSFSLPNGLDVARGDDPERFTGTFTFSACIYEVRAERLHSRDGIIDHLDKCPEAQEYLQVKKDRLKALV